MTTRRQILGGTAAIGAAGALAACAPSSTGTSSQSDPVTVAAADVPVGSGTISGSVVVTQPTAGEFKAFSATCTHQNCLVSRIVGEEIQCTCHGSVFSAVDGSVLQGPASRALATRSVTVEGDTLTVS